MQKELEALMSGYQEQVATASREQLQGLALDVMQLLACDYLAKKAAAKREPDNVMLDSVWLASWETLSDFQVMADRNLRG